MPRASWQLANSGLGLVVMKLYHISPKNQSLQKSDPWVIVSFVNSFNFTLGHHQYNFLPLSKNQEGGGIVSYTKLTNFNFLKFGNHKQTLSLHSECRLIGGTRGAGAGPLNLNHCEIDLSLPLVKKGIHVNSESGKIGNLCTACISAHKRAKKY